MIQNGGVCIITHRDFMNCKFELNILKDSISRNQKVDMKYYKNLEDSISEYENKHPVVNKLLK